MKRTTKLSSVLASAAVVCLIAFPAVAGGQGGGGDWDLDMNYVAPFDFWAPNGCQDTWQMVHAFGESHWHLQVRYEKDEDGNNTGAYDMKVHANHQGGEGIGYDLVMNEDGHPVEGDDHGWTIFHDEDGNTIDTEYSVPGTYNYWHHGTNNVQQHTVYMCMLISHGGDGNVIIHLNQHLKLDIDTGEFEVTNINAWIKCAGAQDKNGMVNCEDEPDKCELFNPLDWF